MNICIVAQRYPYKDNMDFIFVKKIVDEWARMGHRCVVVTIYSITSQLRGRIVKKPAYYVDKLSEDICVEVYNPRCVTFGDISIGDVSIDGLVSSYVIHRQLEKLGIKFDFIYCHFFLSALYAFPHAKKTNTPLYVATGESNIPIHKKPSFNFSWEEFRKFTRGVVSVSSKNRNEAAEKHLIDSSKCEVFPNATDLSIFKIYDKNECRKALNFSNDEFLICCVGFFCERKGQSRILSAIEKLNNPKIKALFIGRGAEAECIKLEGEHVAFKGPVNNSELPYYLNAADVFCLPTRHEGCCNAIIEAMACGSAIISSNRPFNHDVLNEDNSILIDPDSVEEIANAIGTLYNNRKIREALSNAAYQDARRLGINQRSKRILEFIQSKMP